MHFETNSFRRMEICSTFHLRHLALSLIVTVIVELPPLFPSVVVLGMLLLYFHLALRFLDP